MPQDPTKSQPTPPQHTPPQDPPGHTKGMHPKPDHGEESYRGAHKLEGRAAIITGAR